MDCCLVLDSLYRWLAKAQSRRPPDFLSGYASQDAKLEHRGDFTQEADLVCGICGAHGGYEIAKCVMFEEMVGGAGCVGGQEKEWMECFLDDLRAFGASTPTSGRLQLRTRGDGAERQNKGRNISWRNGLLQRKPRLDYGMQWYART